MGYWAKLASRAAFRSGKGKYCGHSNRVSAGSWAGGMVGLKSILGVRSRDKARAILKELADMGFVSSYLDTSTKKLTYSILDWVVECSGEACLSGSIYATDGFGFLCVPRSLTDRLVAQHHIFDEADAYLDLWCHTVWHDTRNPLSFAAPAVQYGRKGIALTLDTLGTRWNWEKTKVWRFFRKHEDAFALHKLPGSFGCLIVNKQYPDYQHDEAVVRENIMRILNEMRIWGKNTHFAGADNNRINRLCVLYSQYHTDPESLLAAFFSAKNRVALSPLYKRAYFSDCWNCVNSYKCIEVGDIDKLSSTPIRGPCRKYGPRFQF